MSGLSAISNVGARISAIEARFSPAADPQSGAVPVIDDGAEFDPFGEVYQNAITARDAGGFAATTGSLVAGSAFYGSTALTGSPAAGGVGGFDSASITAAINGVATTPGARPIGGYGSMPVPDALRSYGNGQIPTAALTPLATQSGHRLYAPAAASWNNVVEAARRDGIELRITDSYRDYDEQVDLVRRKGLYSQGGLAATPGTSIHGWGLAVDADVTDPRTLQWMKTNGPRFGWVEAVPREPWHWEFRPGQV